MPHAEPAPVNIPTSQKPPLPFTASSESKRSFLEKGAELGTSPSSPAVYAETITTHDTVLITSDGNRLPGIPIAQAEELNALRELTAQEEGEDDSGHGAADWNGNGTRGEERRLRLKEEVLNGHPDEILKKAVLVNGNGDLDVEKEDSEVEIPPAPADTQPLLPPVPIYGPPTVLRRIQCEVFRFTSGVLSFLFLMVVVGGALGKWIGESWRRWMVQRRGGDPDLDRPFVEFERKREEERKSKGYLEDELVCDIGCYARRVGLDVREYGVTTEDGFIIPLQRIVDPEDLPETWECNGDGKKTKRYPVLMMHGLLQSSGSFCVNDEDSLAFFLCKVGYDVWLGNNRCHFKPKHMVLKPSDPRMWAWNIRQLGILDLPALIFHVLKATSFPKLALVAHSQGTTQTFLALSKSQRPELSSHISVFCALAPALYAGPLIDAAQFRFMRLLNPSLFRFWFGIHSFIPLMNFMHSYCPRRLYCTLGYHVFKFLFNWTDKNWDRAIRPRFFIFSPTQLSSECLRWWLGRECFAAHRCVLREEDPEWFPEGSPPVALWIPKNDGLVDGVKVGRRLRGEKNVKVLREVVLEGYEHLDVVWAVDAVERVGRGVAEVVDEVMEGGREVDLWWMKKG